MKTLGWFIALLVFANVALANTIIVDINGGGQFTSIQAGISAAVTGDTVKVWPGDYFEQVTLNKNITLMGSGYENTLVTGGFNPTVNVSSGRFQWFSVSSTTGSGINISGGVVRNCVINACAANGIVASSGNGSVLNCVIINNGSYGILVTTAGCTLAASNCIARPNGSAGFWATIFTGVLNLSYSNGSYGNTSGNQGCINVDPLFASATDFHISQGSPCWDSGNPSMSDSDGSRSDMGYFGGSDCPIYPTVFEIIIRPNGGTIDLQAKGRANY